MNALYINSIILALVSFFSSLILTYYFKNFFFKRGFIGIDQFKLSHPKIPLLGGLSIPIIIIILISSSYFIGYLSLKITFSLSLSILIILFVGLIDDFITVPGVYKPVACLLGGLPILLLHTYDPHLAFPLGTGFRIAVVYPLLILIGISVAANTVNMLDVINGSAAVGGIMILATMYFSAYIIHGVINPYPFIIGIMVLAGFLFFNVYPAKTFLGNAPALVIGGYIAVLAILYKIEFPTVVSMFPYIHNSFFFLSKIKGFVEHKKLRARVTQLNKHGYIEDARDADAPITLLRFLVSDTPLKESDVFINIFLLFIVSSFFAIASSFLMR